ncbi:MAG TPA: cation:proton antiporter regulatory subunit [Actinomycetota bacterium]|nr:cation:proton antiporter regulatory subunit [Actinomycetota bacterium]
MPIVREVRLPGVGVRFEFETDAGVAVAVIHHRTGERELIVYDVDDPDAGRDVLRLDSDDSRTLSELLGGSQVAKDLAELQQDVAGLAVDRLPVPPASPYAGRTIGDTAARTRTGVSIVAVLRGDEAVPAPGPEFGIEGGDILVVVGTPRGIEDVTILLRSG